MKSLVCLLSLLFVASSYAQKFEVTDVSVNSGKGATTSGLDASIKLTTPNQSLKVAGNAQRAYLIYDHTLLISFSAGMSGGFFKNMPWLGPYATFAPTKWLSIMHWSGWSAGKPDEPSATEINDFFLLNAVYLSVWKVQLRYTGMDFLGDTFSMPGVSLTVPIPIKKVKISVAADYDLRADEPYYNIGVSYTTTTQ